VFIIDFILVDMDNVADILEIHAASMFPPTLKMKYIPPKRRQHFPHPHSTNIPEQNQHGTAVKD
jgi:hypothetical protein